MVKNCLKLSMENCRFPFGVVMTLVSEAALIVKSRPMAARACEDATVEIPIMPLDLQLGRSTVEVPQMKFEEVPSLTRRLQYVKEVKERFWDVWKKQVFQGLLLDAKWRKAKRNVMVGDIVMMLENEDDDALYRLACVVSVKPGEDGRCNVHQPREGL